MDISTVIIIAAIVVIALVAIGLIGKRRRE